MKQKMLESQIRNIRRDAISDFRELLKEKEISEDEATQS